MGIEAAAIGTMAGWLGTAVLGGAAIAGAAASQGGGKNVSSAIPSIPNAPTGAEATAAEKARIRKKTKTILTSPLTGGEDYGTAAPTLLGSGDITKKTTLG